MTSRLLLLLVAGLLLGSGCISMQVPDRFLVIDRGTRQLKAITPDEAKLWVRDFDDEAEGDLGFWAEALRTDLVETRGYVLVSEGRCEDAGGNEGVELVLESTLQGQPQREMLCLLVYPGAFEHRIRVVELVAPKDDFEELLEGARAAVRTLKP